MKTYRPQRRSGRAGQCVSTTQIRRSLVSPKNVLPLRFTGHVENLEDRLALSGNPIVTGDITTAGQVEEAEFTVAADGLADGGKVAIGLRTVGPGGFDPAAPTVFDLAGIFMPGVSSRNDMSATDTTGTTYVQLAAGVYNVNVFGDGDTSLIGDYTLEAFVVGDSMEKDGVITEMENLMAQAAHFQSLGGGNHVSQQLFRLNGIDLTQDLYNPDMDADGDGVIGANDVSLINANFFAGAFELDFQLDQDPPNVTVGLNNDTGIGGDNLTTDPSVSGTAIDDKSDVTSLTVSVDGSAAAERIGDLDPTSGAFALDQSALESILGSPLGEGSHTVSVAATDDLGFTSTATTLDFTFFINDAPQLDTPIPDATTNPGDSFTLDVVALNPFSDPDAAFGDTLTLSTSTLPSWLDFDASQGLFSGTPSNNDVGDTDIAVTATDTEGLSATDTFRLTVIDTQPPVLSAGLANDTGIADDNLTTDPTISGNVIDNSGLVGSLLVSVDGSSEVNRVDAVNLGTGDFNLTRADLESILGSSLGEGSHTVSITSADQATPTPNTSNPAVVSFTYFMNDAPQVNSAIGDQSVDEDDLFTLDITDAPVFGDADTTFGDFLSFAALQTNGVDQPLPAWLTFNASTGQFSGTPLNDDVDTFDVKVTAADTEGASVEDIFTLTVNPVSNDAPEIIDGSIPNQFATQAVPFTVDLNDFFTDPDEGDSIASISVTENGGGLPSWLGLNNGVLSGTPTGADLGTMTFTATAEDTTGLMTSGDFDLTVSAQNVAPVVETPIGDQSADEDSPFSLDVSGNFFDDNGDTLSFTTNTLPAWLGFNGTTGAFTGTPSNDDVGTVNVTVTASDPAGLSASDDFVITVVNTPDAPTVSIGDQDTTILEPFSFDLSALIGLNGGGDSINDPDAGDNANLSIDVTNAASLPDWLTFDNATDTLSGTPQVGDVGSVTVNVSVTDQTPLVGMDTFNINVISTAPPVWANIPDQQTDEDALFSLDLDDFLSDADTPLNQLVVTAVQADGILPDGGPINASPLPAWLVFNVTSRVLSGMPTNDDVGAFNVFVLAADNASQDSALFNIAVVNVNDPPVLDSSIPNQSVTAGSNLSLDLSTFFSDVDMGDVLSFGATVNGGGLPAWLQLNGSVLSGTPSNSDTGTISIQATATDLSGEMADDTFDVTVVELVNQSPMAIDDGPFATDDNVLLTITAAEMLNNDSDPEGETINIIAVDSTSNLGAVVTFDGTTVTYDAIPADLFTGDQLVDTFTYTISDGNSTDTATVSVNLTAIGLIEFRVKFFDLEGAEITEVAPGQEFQAAIFTEDERPAEDVTGVFSVILDVIYPDDLVTIQGSVIHSSTYGGAGISDLSVPGIINEVGGVGDVFGQLGAGEFEVFRVNLIAGNTEGPATFATDPKEAPNRELLAYRPLTEIPPTSVGFGFATINITSGAAAASSAGVASNPNDVNQDGAVTALDALHVVTAMADPQAASSSSTGGHERCDVNRDGSVTPLDALFVISEMGNAVSSEAPASAMSAGAVATSQPTENLDAPLQPVTLIVSPDLDIVPASQGDMSTETTAQDAALEEFVTAEYDIQQMSDDGAAVGDEDCDEQQVDDVFAGFTQGL